MKPSNTQRLKQRFQTPCFECEERYLGCHGKCEKYQAFTKERNSNKKKLEMKYSLHKCFMVMEKILQSLEKVGGRGE